VSNFSTNQKIIQLWLKLKNAPAKLSITPLHDRVIVQPAAAEEKLPVASSYRILQKKNHNVVLYWLPAPAKKTNQ